MQLTGSQRTGFGVSGVGQQFASELFWQWAFLEALWKHWVFSLRGY